MLISVNPFKQMPYFTDREIELYQGAVRLPRGQSGVKSVQNIPQGRPLRVPMLHSPCRGQCSQQDTQQQILENSAQKCTERNPKMVKCSWSGSAPALPKEEGR